jgi:hypothetical protein
MKNKFSKNSRRLNSWRLLIFLSFFGFIALRPFSSYAHQTPNTLVFLDASPSKVSLELQMPLTELELAFGNNITKSPETLIEKFGPQLKEYLKAHIHAYVNKNLPWQVEITSLRMDKGQYIESGINYWELVANVAITPQAGESTRKFTLDYDVIMHQVINHAALLSIRSDWETGKLKDTSTAQAMVISRNTADNVIYPVEINLKKGNWFQGFKSMLMLGIEHIKEGTDHLLFLLTLLLPAALIAVGGRWAKHGSTRYSLVRILKIVTAFTIGHSITLLIGATGLIHFPGRQIEVLIAVSILVSAIHALKPIFPGKEMYIAAGFGLIHGMAFAQTLANLNLDWGRMALSILGFNIGIELMQLFVIAITIPWLIILSRTKAYDWVRITGALFAVIASVAWIVERITLKSNPISVIVTRASAQAQWIILLLATIAVLSFFVNKRMNIVVSK